MVLMACWLNGSTITTGIVLTVLTEAKPQWNDILSYAMRLHFLRTPPQLSPFKRAYSRRQLQVRFGASQIETISMNRTYGCSLISSVNFSCYYQHSGLRNGYKVPGGGRRAALRPRADTSRGRRGVGARDGGRYSRSTIAKPHHNQVHAYPLLPGSSLADTLVGVYQA